MAEDRDDLLGAVAALARAADDDLPPDRLLAGFSARLAASLPHDRLVVAHLDEGGRTFTIVAEQAARGPLLHREHYSGDFARAERYVVDDWGIRDAFGGQPLRVDDFGHDPRFTDGTNPHERRLWDAGFRSGVVAPLGADRRVVGVLVAMSLAPAAYGDADLHRVQEAAALIAPIVETVVLRQRERRRHTRLAALGSVSRALGASLNVREVFERLAATVRPLLDFDFLGVALISASGREIEMLAEVDDAPTVATPDRIPLEDFSFAEAIERGDPVLVHDAAAELDRGKPGDRLIVEGGGRSVLGVPLWLGEAAGGALYAGKRRPYWFDASDVEIAAAVAAQVSVAVLHQRLAGEQRRLAHAEGRARRLEARVASLRTELGERFGFEAVIGRAPALRDALTRATKVAPTDTTVLVTGESGTGKELVARAIHAASLRADGPFVAVNCAALPETLLESELFGHERGAFTGAERQRPGRFELAQGGTLFLDEIAELSPATQAKLLRVLQERRFERVGGTATLVADVRLVTATNRELEREVEAGRFREDLFYRLHVFVVHLPPLRERGEDVLLLADHFVRTLGARMGRGEPGLARDAREALLAHRWPGNIRELQNAIERALIVSEGGLITAAQLGLGGPRGGERDRPAALAGSANRSLPDWERQIVADALERAGGNRSRAARLLGLTRSQLYTRLKRYGLA